MFKVNKKENKFTTPKYRKKGEIYDSKKLERVWA